MSGLVGRLNERPPESHPAAFLFLASLMVRSTIRQERKLEALFREN
jgi:hypothetical protein